MMFSSKVKVFALFAVSLVAASCSKDFLDSEAEKAVRDNENAIVAYIQKNNIQTTKTSSGLHYVITKKNAAGKTPTLGEQVVVYYKLNLLDGSFVDSTKTAAKVPLKFPYINGIVFDGFLESVGLMKEGEQGTFFIPSNLAFQNQQVERVPAWSVIKAELEVVGFRTEEQQIDIYVSEKALKNVEKTQTGLRFILDSATASTNGAALNNGDIVAVRYSGTMLDAAKPFDAGDFTMTIGSGGTIKGFEEGVKKMKVGEKATVIFPSSIGYGSAGASAILPYAPLRFDLEILSKR